MKNLLVGFLLWVLCATAMAERPSNDELALHLGVRDWFLIHSAAAEVRDERRLQTIYRADVEFHGTSDGLTGRGVAAYAAVWQPLSQSVEKFAVKFSDDVAISVHGEAAVTTFHFRPEGAFKDGRPLSCDVRVTLDWERREGMWKIVHEEITPLDATPTNVVIVK